MRRLAEREGSALAFRLHYCGCFACEKRELRLSSSTSCHFILSSDGVGSGFPERTSLPICSGWPPPPDDCQLLRGSWLQRPLDLLQTSLSVSKTPLQRSWQWCYLNLPSWSPDLCTHFHSSSPPHLPRIEWGGFFCFFSMSHNAVTCICFQLRWTNKQHCCHLLWSWRFFSTWMKGLLIGWAAPQFRRQTV